MLIDLRKGLLVTQSKNVERRALTSLSDPTSQFTSQFEGFVPFGKFIEESTEMVRPFDDPEKMWPVYGVNNRGGVFFSHHQKGSEFNAPYKRVRRDWFFHNPTRANVGSLGRVPQVEEDAITSPEYQVWKIKDESWIPQYVDILIQLPFFQKLIQVHRVGAVKERLYTQNLLQIPVPPHPKKSQQAIVDRWEQAHKKIAAGQERIRYKERETAERFIRELGLTPPKPASGEKGFAVQWKDFARWSVSYNHTASSLPDLTKGKYPVVSLGAILEMVQYGTSEKANQAENGTPILRINNIKDGRIDTADMKHIPIREKQKGALRLEDGDILIIRTSGSRNLVGTCAAFHEEGEFCFASYLIRLRVRKNRATPDFVAYYINSPLGRQQVDSLSRKIMQNNINSEEIRSLQIPLPPLPVQQEILRLIVKGRAEVSRIRGAVQEIANDSKREIESLILGTKKVDGREPIRLTS